MFTYFLLLFLPLMFSIRYSVSKEYKYIKASLFSFFVGLLIILSLRNKVVGRDVVGYLGYYNIISSTTWSSLFTSTDLEPGYVLFNKLISLISTNSIWFLFITSLIMLLPLALIYANETKRPFLTIVLFLNMTIFTLIFSGIRQSMAIVIGMIAYLFVKKGKVFPFLFFVALASLFHMSALILLLMYPAYWIKVGKVQLILLMLSFAVIFIFKEKVFNFILSLLNKKYQNFGTQSTGAFNFLIMLVAFCIFSIVFTNENDAPKQVVGLRNFLFISLFIQLFAPISTMAMRFGYYFLVYIPILIPQIITQKVTIVSPVRRFAISFIACFLVVFFTLYFYYRGYSSNDSLDVFPYIPFWVGVD